MSENTGKWLDPERLEQLKCYLLAAKPRCCKKEFKQAYNKKYTFWRDYLKEALLQENNTEVAEHLSSDWFFEKDEGVYLFKNEDPIGMFMFRWFDISFDAVRELKYFTSQCPENTINNLCEQGHERIMIMGNLVVEPSWRKAAIGYGVTDILMDFAVKRFLDSPATALLTLTRNNRKTHDLCYRHGGKAMEKNHAAFGVKSDVVVIERGAVKEIEEKTIKQHADILWKEKVFASNKYTI